MDKKDIERIISASEYDFLREDEHLKDKVLFLTIGGSHAYGTNIEGSDIDLRGVALNSKQDLLGLGNFEHYVDKSTDTTVFGLKKAFQLLAKGNPNMIEMLGNTDDKYLILRPEACLILMHKHIFLSKASISSFGGFITKLWKETTGKCSMIDLNDERSMVKARKTVMNMIRLYYMVFDLLEKEIIKTERKVEQPLLMAIRTGGFPIYEEKDGRVVISEWLRGARENLEERFQYAKANTNLPDEVNMHKVQSLLIEINEMWLRESW